MQKELTIKLRPSEASSNEFIKSHLATELDISTESITGFHILKKSLDARGKQPWILLSLIVFINEPFSERFIQKLRLTDVSKAETKVIIVGSGPAGLFAALKLIESGIQPVLLERGKDVRARRRDLALLNKEGIVNPESNYCFGEGGAGTYSDGKLYTRSTKRGNVSRILNVLVEFGAPENILYDAHPHIGTNKLPQIITSMREMIIECGGLVLFEKKVTDITFKDSQVTGILTAAGDFIDTNRLILATGHSARDIYTLLHSKKIRLEFKPFALGVRVEHPQHLIDSIQYHYPVRQIGLPPASYSLVHQVEDRGVFSFCMCPGGIIAPASTNAGEIVVNGWSPSKRNNPFANSGMVVSIEQEDLQMFSDKGTLAGMNFQASVEKKAYEYGGGKLIAPAQRMIDFTDRIVSSSLPECSYVPGICSSPLDEVLPQFVYKALQKALPEFGKKMKGFFTNDAVIVATESRTSSPVRIPRDAITFQHLQVKGLYPCSEGAGYAGGIVSAAMDGERVAERISLEVRS